MTAYLHRQGILVIPYLDDWLIHHPDRQVLLRDQALLLDTLDLVGFILNRKKSELDLTQDIQFLGIHLRLDLGKALLPASKAWEIVARARHLSSLEVLDYTQVSQLLGSLNWASGLIPLGRLYLRPLQRHFHSLGLTDRFTPPRRSDPLVLANLLRRWLEPRNPEDPSTRVDISSGSASLTASQLLDQETMSRKSAAAASTALSLAEFIDNYPGMPEGARAAMLLLKLDIVSFLHYAWREVHNKLLLRRSIALDCLERTLPPIDEDQKLALLHAPFKGTTLFGGELAKLQEATFTVFPQPTAPSTSYSARPYVVRGKSFKDKKGFRKPGGKGRGQIRSAPSAKITRPGQSKDGQKALTVSVSTDSKKRKTESQDDAPQGPRKAKRNFRGDKNKGNKQ